MDHLHGLKKTQKYFPMVFFNTHKSEIYVFPNRFDYCVLKMKKIKQSKNLSEKKANKIYTLCDWPNE